MLVQRRHMPDDRSIARCVYATLRPAAGSVTGAWGPSCSGATARAPHNEHAQASTLLCLGQDLGMGVC